MAGHVGSEEGRVRRWSGRTDEADRASAGSLTDVASCTGVWLHFCSVSLCGLVHVCGCAGDAAAQTPGQPVAQAAPLAATGRGCDDNAVIAPPRSAESCG